MDGGEGREGGRGEMTVIHILMAPRYLYQAVHVLRNNVSQWHHVTNYVITHSVSTSHNNGTYYVRLDEAGCTNKLCPIPV